MFTSYFHLINKHCIVAFLIITIFPPFSHTLSFNITDFGSRTSNIAYEGDAVSLNGYIELNKIGIFHTGRATYSEPLQLWDSSTGILTDFATRFSFIIEPPDYNSSRPHADGFAFYIAAVGYPIPPNSGGHCLGLFNSTTYSGGLQNQIVHVEFDTHSNDFDPPMKHVGININSLVSRSFTSFDIDSFIGKQGHALITYDSYTKKLSLSWTFNGSRTTFEQNHSVSQTVDLMEVLPEWVTIGFSAATGSFFQRHVIQSWEFSSTLQSSIASEKTNKNIKVVVVAGTCSFALVLIAVCVCWLFVKKREKSKEKKGNSVDFDLNKATLPRRFYYQELVAATEGFADDRNLGRGGSGQVYKGILNDVGRVVAVKRIFSDFEKSEEVFINEVKIISRLIHRNLVQFIGWCHQHGEFLLVYDYMPNGSLDTHLFGNRRILPWNTRYKIALGVAAAIHYLHEDAEQCVLHRDIKSANVLLDSDFSAKLGDFEVAKLVDPRLRSQRTRLVGTLGYLPPEYIIEGRASKESDIYSFGVVALEIASGRRTYPEGEYHKPLLNWIWKLYVEGNVLDAADEGLINDFDVNEMICLLIVGLWCTHPIDKERPKAAQVIKVLQLESPLPVLPPDMHNFGDAPRNHVGQSDSFQSQPITSSLTKDGR